ncbi:site-specific integrase [Sphingomonas koreensis]|jgi:integrase|uniref:Recombinase n=2 Tax=Sphingomonas koreensis TaxID=93064 RepID=A0A1L6J646_9SPHN|nr:site-specific integrase [Sphingomonas koreensis]APR51030.1 recombinase [Sphingomonas koreensis]MDC7810698.1 tyrosine-type recombinase/integrase [Sphingomonas koreensis]RSU20310.1 site-specific integrase [Sphingomonas koreensis]RSU22233.1 site-specific integrase [Sphingomonas koreensis]RSU29494.1 site-specific integrase [Sphingomonas koreensis]
MALTALRVAKAKPGTYCDGKGLLLRVTPTGAKSWMLRIQHNGRRRDFGLGSADWVTLAEARATAAALRADIKKGIEAIGRETKRNITSKTQLIPTFDEAARKCYETLSEGWDDRRKKNWISSLENHTFPLIGRKPIDTVDSAMVRGALEPIWLKIPETARRILQRISSVLDFAHIEGWRREETSLRTVIKGLPRQTDRGKHFEAMPYAEAPSLIDRLISEPTVSRDALRLLIYTAARSNEIRNATWPEFDLDAGVWSIPAERMKARVAHTVPLSAPAVALLKTYWRARRGDDALVFSIGGKKPLSDMTLSKLLKALNVGSYTVHGFRSSFTDWAAERTRFPKEVADKALAHRIPDQVEAAYRRTDFFEKRGKLMSAWANYLHGQSSAKASVRASNSRARKK